jgi:hypothetical protein
MAICRECKKEFNEFLTGRPREYCGDNCMKIHSRRAAKARAGLIVPHMCAGAVQIMQTCVKCPNRPWTADNPACARCHENHTASVCSRSHRAPYNGGRLRMVCPADCRVCPHSGAAEGKPEGKPSICPTCGQPIPSDRGDGTQGGV